MAHSVTLAPPPTVRSPEATMLALATILAVTSLVAGLGALTSGGEADPWYAALDKAPGTPPGYVFGLVWPLLYALMALGAFVAWRGGARLGLYMAQLIVNLAWSYLFFSLHQPLPALIDLIVLWGLAFLMIRQFGRHNRIAGAMQLPYLGWLTFAGYLNVWVVFAN